MRHGSIPAPVALPAEPALTVRERFRGNPEPVFATLVEEFHELRTQEVDRGQALPEVPLEAVLRLTGPGQRVQQLRLRPGQVVVIGRSRASDLKLRDPALSRTHVKVTLGAMGVCVTDLGSTNGSYMNGVPFVFTRLAPGDHVLFGQSLLEVVRVSATAQAA